MSHGIRGFPDGGSGPPPAEPPTRPSFSAALSSPPAAAFLRSGPLRVPVLGPRPEALVTPEPPGRLRPAASARLPPVVPRCAPRWAAAGFARRGPRSARDPPSRGLVLGLRPLRGLRRLRASPRDCPNRATAQRLVVLARDVASGALRCRPGLWAAPASRYNAGMTSAAAKGRKLFFLAAVLLAVAATFPLPVEASRYAPSTLEPAVTAPPLDLASAAGEVEGAMPSSCSPPPTASIWPTWPPARASRSSAWACTRLCSSSCRGAKPHQGVSPRGQDLTSAHRVG